MIKRTVTVCGQDVTIGASALVPKIYRINFGRDIIQDINILRKSLQAVEDLPENATEEDRNAAALSAMDLTIFERIAWTMAYHADKENVPHNPDEWLEGFDGIFSIYEVFPAILELWGLNNSTTSVPAKK